MSDIINFVDTVIDTLFCCLNSSFSKSSMLRVPKLEEEQLSLSSHKSGRYDTTKATHDGEVYAWADDQRERKRREFFQLLDRGRDIWTPRHIFDRCCVKWLIHGRIQHDEYGGFYDSPFDPPKGCNGCSRDHPCITLRFDVTTKSTIAHLSHRLDQFLHFMDGLVENGTAWPQSASEYKIDGHLRPNLNDLRSHDGFGGHLIEFEDSELHTSDAAQRAEREEREACERAAKRPRKTEEGVEEDLDTEGLAAAAMDAVMKHQFLDDPLTLSA